MRLLPKLVSVFLVNFWMLTLSVSPAFSEEQDEYLIGSEDVLEIAVWQSPDLTKTVTVNSRGEITYPFIGVLPITGKTPKYLEQILKNKLAQGYVKDPQVSVSVKEFNSKKVLVFGEVMQPGMYKLKGSSIPVLELLFLVGGVKGDAKRMTIIRPEPNETNDTPSEKESRPARAFHIGSPGQAEQAKAIEVNLLLLLAKGDLSQNISIEPGDTIYVSSGTGEKFYVLGQVAKPGPYEWIPDISVLEAIKQADGATPTAALNRITIRRQNGGGEEVMKLNVVDIMKGKKKDDLMVKAGDVIVVPESWI